MDLFIARLPRIFLLIHLLYVAYTPLGMTITWDLAIFLNIASSRSLTWEAL